jgi:hypothetical protein
MMCSLCDVFLCAQAEAHKKLAVAEAAKAKAEKDDAKARLQREKEKSSCVLWEAEVDGKWLPFDSDLSRGLESAHRSEQVGHTFSRGQHQYTVEWETATTPNRQVNVKTQMKRELRRWLVPRSGGAAAAVVALTPAPATAKEVLTRFGQSISKYTIVHHGAAGFGGPFEDFHGGRAHSQFHQMLGTSAQQFKITRVEYYDNPELKKRFEATRAGLQSKQHEWVFHGTSSAETAHSIMQEGFLVGGVDTSRISGCFVPVANGKQFGTGIYTARGPGAPVQYAARSGGARGSNCVILAKALLGTHMPGSTRPGGADSWSPPGYSGDWVIFARTELLLPCYIVFY